MRILILLSLIAFLSAAQPPPNAVSPVGDLQWAGVLAEVKEGLARLQGPVTAEQQQDFEARWAPAFDHPAPEILAWAQRLRPLVRAFQAEQAALARHAVAGDRAQFDAVLAVSGDDAEGLVEASYRLRRQRLLLNGTSTRLEQIAAQIAAIGPMPDPAALKKQAAARHRRVLAIAAGEPQPLEKTWSKVGRGKSSFNLQILAELSPDLSLVETSKGRGLLEAQPQLDTWVLIVGSRKTAPGDCSLYRLAVRNGQLLIGTWTPPRAELPNEAGTFTLELFAPQGPLKTRKTYDPAKERGDDGNPVDWPALYHARIQARAAEMKVLRLGSLEPQAETSRRRLLAQSRVDASKIDDMVQRNAVWRDGRSVEPPRDTAEHLCLEIEEDSLRRDLGDQPPGFYNCRDFLTLAPILRQAGIDEVVPHLRSLRGINQDMAVAMHREWMAEKVRERERELRKTAHPKSPDSVILARELAKTEKEYDLLGKIAQELRWIDERMPGTADLVPPPPGLAPEEIADRRAAEEQRRTEAAAALAAVQAQVAEAESLARQQQAERELEEKSKAAKKAMIEEEITRLDQSLAGVRASLADARDAKDADRLQREALALEAWITTARDHLRAIDTGVFQRTRTTADALNQNMMEEQAQAQRRYWDDAQRNMDRIERLIAVAKPEDRDALRLHWDKAVAAALAEGGRLDSLDETARQIGRRVSSQWQAEGAQADAAAATAQMNLGLAEDVKYAADWGVTICVMVATAGTSSAASLILPTCAETAVSAAYGCATGYIDGGAEGAFRSAAARYSFLAGTFDSSMRAYQQGVLDHLEAQARDPMNAAGSEATAGLSAMGKVLARQGLELAATTMMVTPLLAGLKDSLKKPAGPAGGIFGSEPIRFKTAREMAQERKFLDASLNGKRLMNEFRDTTRKITEARAQKLPDDQIKALLARREKVYEDASHDFFAKCWLKRVAAIDDDLAPAWNQLDAPRKARVIAEARAILAAQGLSQPELRCFSNSSSKGGVPMDLDLGLVEPRRYLDVPSIWNKDKTMQVPNPAYAEWRKTLTMTGPDGKRVLLRPDQYAEYGHQALLKAHEKVYGRPPPEDFLDFTHSGHKEAYKDKAWLGREGDTQAKWADFCNVDPRFATQAADVTAVKIAKFALPPKPGDPAPSLPLYGGHLEACRGLLKDFDTKMIGAKADTGAFGNEAGRRIVINPASPLGRAQPAVQQHFLAIREVLLDFSQMKITPVEAELRLKVLTGGKGLIEIPEQMRAVLAGMKK